MQARVQPIRLGIRKQIGNLPQQVFFDLPIVLGQPAQITPKTW